MGYGDGQIMVTFETIAQASQSVNQTQNNLNQKLSDLHSMLGPITSDWTGAAAEAYQAKQRQWDQAQQDLNQVLAQVSKVLEAAHDAYRSTESSNANAWQ
jgi:WXG100 family type VII secretion target